MSIALRDLLAEAFQCVFITNGVSELVHDTCIEYTGQLYNNNNNNIYTYYKLFIILYKIYIIATLVYQKSVFY